MSFEGSGEEETTTGSAAGVAGYTQVLRTPGVPLWAFVMVCQRLPVAMAPLALVYLGYEITGSFAAGALLAGGHALAEALFAPWLGRRFDLRPANREAFLVLAAEAVLYVGLFAFGSLLPFPVVVVLAALGGGVAAGAHGGLRSLLQRLVPVSSRQAAFSFEETTSAVIWSVGPMLVAGLIVVGTPSWPTLALGVAAALGAVAALGLPSAAQGHSGAHGTKGVLRKIWPSITQDAAAMFTLGSASVALPALLTGMGASEALPGVILGMAAAAGVAGGLVYGLRRWPAQRLHASILVVLYCFVTATLALVPEWYLVAAIFVFAGLIEVPTLVSRAILVQEDLDESQWAFGFSAVYSGDGIGYGLAGILVAALLTSMGPAFAIGVCALAAGVLSSAAAAYDLFRARRAGRS
ncbi:MFS transporter [Nocardiopsis kunsanensis]|uniref:MFS transporter n=1 Tax=Nocardiopsis kunsanensis TaxID=141693 RepID=A0A918XM87_9ACTN|nr:hypothetical protein [Nocardiopsis kunsanensis]GHD37251.1 MFS transporter [Nocardiopsis kunsanensis]